LFTAYIPVNQVDKNINANGIQVPSRLVNIAKLRLITITTGVKSTRIKKVEKLTAVCSGVVWLNFYNIPERL
jgi:hypothetical protein